MATKTGLRKTATISISADALEGLGLGRITPFIKLGIEKMETNFRELEDDLVGLIDNFDDDKLAGASKLPPLGDFQSVAAGLTPLSPARLTEVLKAFNGLIGVSGGPNGKSGFDSLRRVFGAVNLLHNTFNDYKQYTKQAAGSVYGNLRM